MPFLTETFTGVDANTSGTVTDTVNVRIQTSLSWEVKANTGTHNDHKVILQKSLDGSKWHKVGALTGVGGVSEISRISAGYVRFRVVKEEGSASTVDITLNAK